MAQLERMRRSCEGACKTPKQQTSPTFEQLLRVEEAHWPTSPSPAPGMNIHDQEEYSFSPTSQDKKSVLAKVKERARRFKYSLSGRKKNGQELGDEIVTPPSSGITLDQDDDQIDDVLDSDPEYLGAPMYESEAAPESLKETARQHPRAVPVVCENHLFPNRILKKEENKNPVDPIKTTTPETVTEKQSTPSEKQSPSTAMSYATDKIASKIAGLSVNTTPEAHETTSDGTIDNEGKKMMISSSSCSGSSPQTWDKGVSVKEYFMNKLEPGEDERALSQVITDAISPRKSPGGGDSPTVVEKFKGVVNSLFRHDHQDPSNHKRANSANVPSSTNSTHQNRHCSVRFAKVCHPAKAHSSPPIPLSTNSQEVHEEENHGKILQAN